MRALILSGGNDSPQAPANIKNPGGCGGNHFPHIKNNYQRRLRSRAQAACLSAVSRHFEPWSNKEEEFLKKQIGKLSKEKIARELGRTFYGVRIRWQRICEQRKAEEESKTMSSEIVLKRVLNELAVMRGISVAAFAARVGMARTNLHNLLHRGELTKKDEAAGARTRIRQELLKLGINNKDVFELVNQPTQSKGGGLKPVLPDEWRNEMLSQEALEYFKLEADPFERSAVRGPEDIFWTANMKSTRDAIKKAIARRSFLAVWGQVGAGKTLLWQDVSTRLDDNVAVVKPVMIERESLSVSHLQDAFIYDLKALRSDYTERTRSSREAKDRQIRDLLQLHDQEGKTVVLLLEEAHAIPRRTLRALKRLHEMQVGWSSPLAIILLGQPELNKDVWGDLTVREVTRRCRLIELPCLRAPELRAYLKFKFERVGAALDKVINDDGMKAVAYRLKEGAPALQVNNLITLAMNRAAEIKSGQVSGELICSL